MRGLVERLDCKRLGRKDSVVETQPRRLGCEGVVRGSVVRGSTVKGLGRK